MAHGVQYLPNKRFHPDAKTEVLTALARRLVVLSAGAFGSPSILERSGIGSREVLDKAGVKQVVDLPGVGHNYQGVYGRSLSASNAPTHCPSTPRAGRPPAHPSSVYLCRIRAYS